MRGKLAILAAVLLSALLIAGCVSRIAPNGGAGAPASGTISGELDSIDSDVSGLPALDTELGEASGDSFDADLFGG